MADVAEQEYEALQALEAGRLEFPRMLCRADGTQVRVETTREAREALEAGLTLTPTAPAPNDGGTPNVPVKVVLPQAIQDAITGAVQEAVDAPRTVPEGPAVTVPDEASEGDDGDDEDDDEGEGEGEAVPTEDGTPATPAAKKRKRNRKR